MLSACMVPSSQLCGILFSDLVLLTWGITHRYCWCRRPWLLSVQCSQALILCRPFGVEPELGGMTEHESRLNLVFELEYAQETTIGFNS